MKKSMGPMMMLMCCLLLRNEPLFSQVLPTHGNDKEIRVLELRNYVVKSGTRESFIAYFENKLIQSQNQRDGYVIGQYHVKDHTDNFFWIRGYADMTSRSKFLPAFYQGPFWKAHRELPNSLLVNNDNVHLLKPLVYNGKTFTEEMSVSSAIFKRSKGLAVVDFYIANTKLKSLIALFEKKYNAVLAASGINDYSVWISELQENDFPQLPVFQDKNLLVTITFYEDESDYQQKLKIVESLVDNDLKAEFQDIITLKTTLLLYPTKKSAEHR